MFEAYEELIEIWWFKHYAKGKSNDLFQFMCVDRMESRFLMTSHTFSLVHYVTVRVLFKEYILTKI